MLLDGDGFDHYGGNSANLLLGIHAQNFELELVTTQVRTGTHSCRIKSPTGVFSAPGFRRVVPAGLRTVLGVGFAFYMNELPVSVNSRWVVEFQDINAQPISTFWFRTDGRVSVHRGSAEGPQLGLSTLPVLNATAWNFLEFKLGASATVGITGMRVNQIEVDGLMLDNQNTAGTGGLISQYRIGNVSSNGSMESYLDDLVVWDTLGDDNNDWVGDQQLLWRPPTADHPSLPIEFEPSTGLTLWNLIDEANPSAVDYIRALAANKQAAFEFDDLPADIASIAGIIPYIFGKKLNPGTCTVNMGMLTDGLVGDAIFTATTPDLQMTTVDTFWRGVLERNPATLLPYTPAEVNGSHLYLDRVA